MPKTNKRQLVTNKAMTAVQLIANVDSTMIHDKGDYFLLEGIPVTMDDAVMNGIRYPAAENEKGMETLRDRPITLSHPKRDDGSNASAYDGESLFNFYGGGYISNTYRKDNVWYADAKVNKKQLCAAKDGDAYYNRLVQKKSIGVSTGLYGIVAGEVGVQNGIEYSGDMTEQQYDHLAMLRDNERPAGGDVTVMRFNGKECNAMTVNVSELIAKGNTSGLDFTGGHRAKMQEFTEQAEAALGELLGEDDCLWIEDWNEDTMLFYTKGDTFAIGYDASGGSIEFSGEPVQVTLAPSYKPLSLPSENDEQLEGQAGERTESLLQKLLSKLGVATNGKSGNNSSCNDKFTQANNEGMSMSHYDALAAKLNMNADEVKALSDDELTAKLNGLGGAESQTQATNSTDIEAVVTQAVTAALNAQQQAAQAGQKRDLVAKLAANEKVGLSEAQLNKLDVEDLQELQDKHGVTAGLNGSFSATNSGFDMPEMPE